jgi:hypothetical protein
LYITLLVQNEDQHIYSAARRGFRRAQCLDHRAPRAQYAALGSRGPVPSGFGGLGESQINEHLDERFNEALDFVDDPVYRSASAHLSWQPANDELDFDSDEPVYRSLGGFGSSTGGFAVDYVDVDVWMRSGRAGLTRGLDAAHAPARVQRQSAVSHLGPVRAPPPPTTNPPTPPHRCACAVSESGDQEG